MGLNEGGGREDVFFSELHSVYLAAYSVDFYTWIESGILFVFFHIGQCLRMDNAGWTST